jgi:hypothetical protein
MRTADGTHNDLWEPNMGAAETRFGRAVPLERTVPDPASLLTPNPREISNLLLARRNGFIPATSLNLLAAAWAQFQVHDWFHHGPPERDAPYVLPRPAGDDYPEPTIEVQRTRPGPNAPGAPAPIWINTVTHWWDASQIYGSSLAGQRRVRAHRHGKLAVTERDLLPCDDARIDITGLNDNWWVGLSLLHTLFTLEHNAICDRLRAEHPGWDDEHLFGTARLINAALIAKIHTLEWTPAMLGHPAVRIGMRANWWGLATERLHRLLGRISDEEAISGIPGSPTEHHGAPFAMPEEFVSLYRMHPLIPDEFVFRCATTGAELTRGRLLDVAGSNARGVVETIPMSDLLYSFGVMHPGKITLGNYPKALRAFRRLDGTLVDVAAADIVRDRERGVPRYNAFRELVGRRPIRSFGELNRAWADKLRAVYHKPDGGDDVDQLDLMVGLFAETPPKGFAFSDTAFRVFILMASRRLKSDRFFTTHYTPDVYTRAGIDWIENNDMRSVLVRHHPALQAALVGVDNAFAPWRRLD